MIMTYSFPSFATKIVKGDKKHTFRRDQKKRWRAGLAIHHWMGSPRNTRRGAYPIGEDTCTHVQEVNMVRINADSLLIHFLDTDNKYLMQIGEESLIAQNDGLTVEEFIEYFCPGNCGACWDGRLIHWTEGLQY